MGNPYVISIVVICGAKIGEKLVDKFGEKLYDKFGEYAVNKTVDYLFSPIGGYLVDPIAEYVAPPILDYLVAPIVDYLVTPTWRFLHFLLPFPVLYILFQIIEKLLEKIRDYLDASIWRQQLTDLFSYNSRIKDFRNRINNLKNLRSMVQKQVNDAERKGGVILPNVQKWLRSVNEITEESSKFFDDKLQVNLKFLCRRSRNAKEKKEYVDKLVQEGNSFSKVSYEDGEILKSRKLILKEIMEALEDDGINMIGIYGMGGVGKTTLAKEVVQQAKDYNLFDELVLVVVSQFPNLEKIQLEIAEALDLKFEKKGESGREGQSSTKKDESAGRGQCSTKDKKGILIILDDIWERLELDVIGPSFEVKHKGCKIVLTSRSKDVCDLMGTQRNFLIEVLPEEEGWNLFRKTAGDSVDSPVLKPLADEVAKACAGLPIAIVTVARALKSQSLSDWRDARNQLRKSIPSKQVFSTLESSYNHLESNDAKSFFLLCCLFPEDDDIAIPNLLRYGMGLDLFEDVDTVDEARNRAHKLANHLKCSCLLQDSFKSQCVKIHDVLRDIGISIASKNNHAFLVRAGPRWKELPAKDNFKKYTAISLMSSDIHELPEELDCPQLKILLLQCRSHSTLQFPDKFFLMMKNLKVLDMSGMKNLSLPSSIKYLKNLRTLCLDDCNLKDISKIIELQKLEILSFIGSDIKELFSTEIGKLTSLRLLDLTRCAELTRIRPHVIQGLSKLEGLYMDGSFKDWEIGREDRERKNASLVELEPLSRLIELEIQIRGADLLPKKLGFKNLSRFKISIGTHFKELDHYSYSKILKLELSSRTALTEGVKGLLKEAEHLHLMKMNFLKSLHYDLNTGGFQNLRCLSVENCDRVEYIVAGWEQVSPFPFRILEELHLYELANLKEVCRGRLPSGCFHNLKVLEVRSCNGLKSLFSHSIAKDLSNLVEITVEGCENMEEIVGNEKEAKKLKKKKKAVFPCLRFLVLQNLPNLRNFCSKKNYQDIAMKEPLFDGKVAFTNLEVLRISHIESLQEIFQSQLPDQSFSQLKIFQVQKCHKLSRVAPSSLFAKLKNLNELVVEECDSMKEILELEQRVEKGLLIQLKKLVLCHLPNVSIFCSGNYNFELPSLETFRLEMCSKMETFSSKFTRTPNLETIEVRNNGKEWSVWKGDLNSTIQYLFHTNRSKKQRKRMVRVEG